MNLVPKKISPRYSSIGTYELKFPCDNNEMLNFFAGKTNNLTGKVVLFRGYGDKYITANKLELEFASRQAYLSVRSLEDHDIVEYFRKAESLPHADNTMTVQEAAEFLFKDPEEDDVILILKENGYLNASEVDRAIIESNKRMRSDSSKELTDEELIELLRQRGYVGMRKKSKKVEE